MAAGAPALGASRPGAAGPPTEGDSPPAGDKLAPADASGAGAGAGAGADAGGGAAPEAGRGPPSVLILERWWSREPQERFTKIVKGNLLRYHAHADI